MKHQLERTAKPEKLHICLSCAAKTDGCVRLGAKIAMNQTCFRCGKKVGVAREVALK